MPWSVLSQATSSVGSLALSVAVLGVSDAASFGRFSLAFAFYTVALNANRSIAGSPMILRSARPPEERRGYSRVVLMRTLVLSALAGLVAYPLLTALGAGSGMSLVLALGTPILLVQDTLRFVYFAELRPRMSFGLDAVWTLTQLVAFGVLLAVGTSTPEVFAACWVAACAVSCVFSTLDRRFTVDPHRILPRLWEERAMLGPLSVEMLALGALDFVAVVSVKLVAGASVAGYYRAAFLVLAPFNVALTGILLGAIPRSVIRYDVGLPYRSRLAAPFAALAAFAIVGIAVVWLLPWRPGGVIAGTVYGSAGWLALVIALSAGCATGFASLRVERRLTAAMWIRLAAVPLAGALIAVLADRMQVHGALAGYCGVLAAQLLFIATLVTIRPGRDVRGNAA